MCVRPHSYRSRYRESLSRCAHGTTIERFSHEEKQKGKALQRQHAHKQSPAISHSQDPMPAPTRPTLGPTSAASTYVAMATAAVHAGPKENAGVKRRETAGSKPMSAWSGRNDDQWLMGSAERAGL